MKYKIAFFGTPEPAVEILNHLKSAGIIPVVIVTNPDKPKGKNLTLTSSPVKLWADMNAIPVLQPEKLDGAFAKELSAYNPLLYIVVAYGKIIPKNILDIPRHGALNIHYSLLPKFRGASPIESQILADDRYPGVSIMKLDEKMDHGPIVAVAHVRTSTWPLTTRDLRRKSNDAAGPLLAEMIPQYIEGRIKPVEQDHDKATYTQLFSKSDGLIDLKDDQYKNYLKFQAFSEWPGIFFYIEKDSKQVKVTIKKASYNKKENKLEILRVTPEGKQEMDFEDFEKGYLNK